MTAKDEQWYRDIKDLWTVQRPSDSMCVCHENMTIVPIVTSQILKAIAGTSLTPMNPPEISSIFSHL